MTDFVIELLRLHGDERWSEWGDAWWDHADRLGRLPSEEAGGWQLIDHFRRESVRGTKLDWGALLYPVSKEELIALYSPTTELRLHDPSARSDRMRLSELPGHDRFGLVVVECA